MQKDFSNEKKLSFNNKILFFSFEMELEWKDFFGFFRLRFLKETFGFPLLQHLAISIKNMKTVITQTYVLHFIFGL